MKKTIHILFCLLLPLYFFGQDSTGAVMKKTQLNIIAGAYYKTFLDSKYIEPTTINYGDEFTKHQYERFNKVPTFGFSVGLLIAYNFNKHLGIASGMLYFLRKDIFENNQDTVIKYGNGSSIRDIHNVLKYEYSYNDIEIPFMVYGSVRKFTFYAGCNLSLISYKKATYTYVINQYPNTPQWTTSDKAISGWKMPLKIFPSIQTSYEMQIKNIKFNPYAAFYYALKNQNDFYIQLGINFPLTNNHKSNS